MLVKDLWFPIVMLGLSENSLGFPANTEAPQQWKKSTLSKFKTHFSMRLLVLIDV